MTKTKLIHHDYDMNMTIGYQCTIYFQFVY